MPETIKVLFASGSEDLIPTAIEHMRELFPGAAAGGGFRISHRGRALDSLSPVARLLAKTWRLFRWHFRDKRIRLCAVILQPRMPYWRMRLIAFALSPWNFLALNEAFGHFMLRPSTAGHHRQALGVENAKFLRVGVFAGRRHLHVVVAAAASTSLGASGTGAAGEDRGLADCAL